MIERCGIRIRNEKNVDDRLKVEFLRYGKWLRNNYDFPKRVVVYVKNTFPLKRDEFGNEVSGVFFAPDNFNEEPYIKVATGDFIALKKELGVFNSLFTVLNTLSHEIQHYYQWIDEEKFNEEAAKSGAEQLTYEYIEFYKVEFLKQRFSTCKDI